MAATVEHWPLKGPKAIVVAVCPLRRQRPRIRRRSIQQAEDDDGTLVALAVALAKPAIEVVPNLRLGGAP